MVRRSVSLLVLCTLFIVVSATAAQANHTPIAGLSIDPRSVDFGQVAVGCWQTSSCPTQLVTITNTGKKAVQVSSASSCATINPRFGCDGGTWGGIVNDGALQQCLFPTGGVLAPGASCSFTIVGSPTEVGIIRGYLVMTSDDVPLPGDMNDIVIRLPVTIVGTV